MTQPDGQHHNIHKRFIVRGRSVFSQENIGVEILRLFLGYHVHCLALPIKIGAGQSSFFPHAKSVIP